MCCICTICPRDENPQGAASLPCFLMQASSSPSSRSASVLGNGLGVGQLVIGDTSSAGLLHLQLHLPVWHEPWIPQNVIQPALVLQTLLQLSAIQQILRRCRPKQALQRLPDVAGYPIMASLISPAQHLFRSVIAKQDGPNSTKL